MNDPIQDGDTPAPAPAPAAEAITRSAALFIALAGVLLPLITLGIEWSTHMSGETFFDPIPNPWHGLLIFLVPLANGLLLRALLLERHSQYPRLALFNGLAVGIALFYAVLYLPLTPLSPILMAFYGIGFLPIAPLLAMISALRLRRLMLRAAPQGMPVRRLVAGVALALVAMLAIDLPLSLTRVGLYMAQSDSPATHLRGLRWLRVAGSEDALLRMTLARSGLSTDIVGMLLGVERHADPDQVARVYYEVTGKSVKDQALPVQRGMRAWRESFDSDVGGTIVGNIAPGLALASSRIDGSIDAEAATAYVEWTMAFRNTSNSNQEGRFQLALPPGAVVSRVTLWVGDEEREAAFGTRAAVRNAYTQVVQTRRDPLLVTTAGKDRVLVQLFPVQPGGKEMKIRIGMSVPLALSDMASARLPLPSVAEHNFTLAPSFKHALWLESHASMSTLPGLRQEQPKPGTYALRGDVSEADLAHGAISLSRPHPQQALWSHDSKAGDEAVIVQRFREQAAWVPQRVALVLDTSQPMDAFKNQIADALALFPAGVQLAVVGALDSGPAGPMPDSATAADAAQHIRALSFAGGRDNVAPLMAAWDWAGESERAAIVWIHGPQPLLLQSTDALEQRIERRFGKVRIFELEALAGPNRIGEKLERKADIERIATSAALRGDLQGLFAQWRPDGKQFVAVRERSATRPLDAIQTSEHVARLWAADQVAATRGERDPAKLMAASALAQRYQLVTALTGAVVLETQEQYKDAGLEPVPPGSVPSVPEPETWAMLALVSAILLWQWRARRARRAVRVC